MKHLKHLIFATFSLILLSTSCSIEKRVHRPGYHINWNKSGNTVAEKKEVEVKDQFIERESFQQPQTYLKTARIDNSNELVYATNSNEISFAKSPRNISQIKNHSSIISNGKLESKDDCDLIILRDGKEIQAKVLEVGQNEVKYKNCDNQGGPTFIKNTSEIFMIKYPNGTTSIMKEDEKRNSSTVSVNVNTNTEQNSTNANSSSKSLTVAVVLWFLLGLLGIHRMYLGYVGLGILYLLTGGLCGIGWLVDGILFLTGGLKPKNGDYID